MTRLFVAIKINADQELRLFSRSLKYELANHNIIWIDPENYHLTLFFLGETNCGLLPKIIENISDAVKNIVPFTLKLTTPAMFGSRYKPKVIWIGAEPVEKLQDLHLNIAKSIESIGFKPDRQNFVPHISIARIKKLNDNKHFLNIFEKCKIKSFADMSLDIKDIGLFQTMIHKDGPVYKEIHKFQIN